MLVTSGAWPASMPAISSVPLRCRGNSCCEALGWGGVVERQNGDGDGGLMGVRDTVGEGEVVEKN